MPAWILLSVLCFQSDKYEKAAEGIVFPAADVLGEWSSRGDRHRRVVEDLTDRKHWVRALRLIDEKLGLFSGTCEVEVEIEETADPRPARGGGRNGKGSVVFNVARLVEHRRKLDEVEAARREGKTVRWVIPPFRIEGVVAHELTHVFCGTQGDKWWIEGVASYLGEDEAPLYGFNHRGSRVDSLDGLVPDADSYARGLAFFRWFEGRWGQEKLREFVGRVTRKRESPQDAAAAVTGWAWSRVVVEEKVWSLEYVAKFKPKLQ